MNEAQYIKERLDDQISWYDSKSKEAKKMNKIASYFVLIVSALIPLIVNLSFDQIWMKLIISILGVVITISEGFANFNKYSENWIEYRTVCETLRHEKYMYLSKSGVYLDGNFSFFVERVESVISQENVNWASLNKVEKPTNGKTGG